VLLDQWQSKESPLIEKMELNAYTSVLAFVIVLIALLIDGGGGDHECFHWHTTLKMDTSSKTAILAVISIIILASRQLGNVP
jgi:hypothetical protein